MTRRGRRSFGSTRQLKSGKWQARYRDPLTGKRDVAAPKPFATKREASRWLARLESGAIGAETAAALAADLRLNDYATEWIATRQLRPRTRELYALQLRLHIAPALGDARLAQLRPHHIRRWHSDLLAGHLSEVSVAKVYRLLRSILATVVDDGQLARNPCQLKRAGIERVKERPIPTVEQVVRISDELPARLAAVAWVAALGGLRKGEIFGLARRHVDLAQGSIRVERALQEVTGQGAIFVEPKTDSSRRTVTIPPRLAGILADHLEAHVLADPESLLFTNSYGRPIRATVWRNAWAHATQGASCPDVRLHDLRHLAGTLAAQAGATLRETMDRLGHSSTEAAMRYQHVADQRAEIIAHSIEDLL